MRVFSWIDDMRLISLDTFGYVYMVGTLKLRCIFNCKGDVKLSIEKTVAPLKSLNAIFEDEADANIHGITYSNFHDF